ncbi:MAG: ABC transporter ATP-binding protein [Turicibacter sp.]|nr:ABC transporter ATP-binding protein [Turicibacter sp.]
METVLQVSHLSKKIRRQEIIKDVNFTVNKGDICGFIGPNGAGKTTIIRMLTSLVKPTSGSIRLNGYDVIENRKEALQHLGAIVESPIFFSHMSGEEALMNLALLIPNQSKAKRQQKVCEVLEIVGLSDRKKDKISTYSLGMKQRLGIAQALLNDPTIIILDEPANGLDPLGMVQLRELILKLNKEHNITFFISSHLLDELQKICNRLVIIKKGEIAWKGTKDELLNLGHKGASLEEVFIQLIQ